MSTLEILKAARELISDEKRWTQCHNALDDKGNDVSPLSADAVCFCSVGAIEHAAANAPLREELAAREGLRNCLYGGYSVVAYNDTHAHAEVLALFDRAIARAESEVA